MPLPAPHYTDESITSGRRERVRLSLCMNPLHPMLLDICVIYCTTKELYNAFCGDEDAVGLHRKDDRGCCISSNLLNKLISNASGVRQTCTWVVDRALAGAGPGVGVLVHGRHLTEARVSLTSGLRAVFLHAKCEGAPVVLDAFL